MLSSFTRGVSAAGANAAALFKSPSELDPHRSSTAASFSAARRRLLHGTLVSMGKATSAPDAEFAQRREQLAALEALLRDARREAQAAVEGARRLALAGARLGAAARSVGGAAFGRNAELFARALEGVDERARPQFDAECGERVLAPLDALIKECGALAPALRERDGIKTDVDARARTLDALKGASGGRAVAAETIAHKAAKLEASRDLLAKATAAIGERLRPLEREGLEGSLPAALAAFARAQAAFHAAAAESLAGVAIGGGSGGGGGGNGGNNENSCAGSGDRALPPLPPRAAAANY